MLCCVALVPAIDKTYDGATLGFIVVAYGKVGALGTGSLKSDSR